MCSFFHFPAAALALTLALPGSLSAASRDLSIRPTIQQTAVWCWAAVSEMVLRYYGVPNANPAGNYQCGIVGSLGGACWQDCSRCVTSIGGTFQMAQVLVNYQRINGHHAFRARTEGRLSFVAIIDEIDEGNPVIAGISPSGMGGYYPTGMSEHVALIVGYDDADVGWLKVNDPMPYGLFGYDPYINVGAEFDRLGAYWIPYESLVGHLGYKDTIRLLP